MDEEINSIEELLTIDDAYIAKIEAENAERLQKALDLQREQIQKLERQERIEQIKKRINPPQGMVDFIRKYIQFGEEFTIKDICASCEIPYENHADVKKIYKTILNWRNAARAIFNDSDTADLLDVYDSVESKWDAFINMLNEDDIFLLFGTCGRESRYYQPDWIDKEMLDYDRMMRQFNGHITVLKEMLSYGEDFPKEKGMLIQPDELIIEMTATLHRRQLKIEAKVDSKIKELTTPEEE